MWQEYCKNNNIKFEKVKGSELMQNYYFYLKNKIIILQTNFPSYSNRDYNYIIENIKFYS